MVGRPPPGLAPDAQRGIHGGLNPHRINDDRDPAFRLPELRSEEYREVIGAPPPIAVRSGLVIAAITLVAMFTLTSIVPYPATVAAPVQIMSTRIPETIIARTDGQVAGLAARDGDIVKPGQLLATLEGDGDTGAMATLRDWLHDTPRTIETRTSMPPLPRLAPERLGQTETAYVAVVQAIREFESARASTTLARQMAHQQQVVARRIAMTALEQEKQRAAEAAEAALQKTYAAQAEMVRRGYAAPAYLQQYKVRLETQREHAADARLADADNRLAIIEARRDADALASAVADRRRETAARLETAVNALRASVAGWENDHVMRAVGGGRLRLFGIWANRQHVRAGTRFAVIEPRDSRLTAVAFVPSAGFGRVAVGQRAIIRLTAYPASQYGHVVARVAAISAVTFDDRYRVLLALPRGLTSSRHRPLPFVQNMGGSVEIATKQMSLIRHMLYGLIERDEYK